jgi:hypothetical protein
MAASNAGITLPRLYVLVAALVHRRALVQYNICVPAKNITTPLVHGLMATHA